MGTVLDTVLSEVFESTEIGTTPVRTPSQPDASCAVLRRCGKPINKVTRPHKGVCVGHVLFKHNLFLLLFEAKDDETLFP